nr:G protein-coupled receptor [Proales similis]
MSSNQTLSSEDRYNLQVSQAIRFYLVPFIEIIGGLNNMFILLLIRPSRGRTHSSGTQSTVATASTAGGSSQQARMGLSRSALIYLRSLAVSDTCVIWGSMLQRSWPRDLGFDPTVVNSIVCKLYQYLFCASQVTSSWLLVMFTLEKLLIIYFPLGLKTTGQRTLPVQNIGNYAGRVALGVLLFALSFASLMFWSADLENSFCTIYTSFTFFNSRVAPIMAVITYTYLPFVLILAMNSLICIRLLRREKVAPSGSTGAAKKTSRTLTILLLLITFSFLLLTLPINMLNTIIYANGQLFRSTRVQLVRQVCVTLAKSYYGISLYFYLAVNKKFRSRFKEIISAAFCWPCSSA